MGEGRRSGRREEERGGAEKKGGIGRKKLKEGECIKMVYELAVN